MNGKVSIGGSLSYRFLTNLADMLKYPTVVGEPCICLGKMSEMPSSAKAHLAAFQDAIADLLLSERQELFVRTFDFDPEAALEIGWHLFGEDYKRGEFMAYLRNELRRHNLSEGQELPDHIGNVLKLTIHWDYDLAAEFSIRFTTPALEKLAAHLERKDSPYRHLISALLETIRAAVHRPTVEADAVQIEETNQL